MKRLITILMAAALAFTALPARAGAAEPELFVTLNGLLQKATTAPVVINGVTMAAIRDLSDILGATLKWDAKAQKVSMTMTGRMMECAVGETAAVVNHRKVTMPAAPALVNGKVMVPLRFLCDEMKLTVGWDEGKRLVSLSDGGEAYSVFDAKKARQKPPKDAVSLTMKQALEKAAAQSAALKDQGDAMGLITRRLQDIDDLVNSEDGPGRKPNGTYTQEDIELTRSQQKLGNQLKAAKLTEQAIREGLGAQLVTCLIDIRKAELDQYLAEEKLALDERTLEGTKLKAQLGMESQSAVDQLNNTIAKDKANLSALSLRQDGNKLKLTNMLGLKAGTAVNVTDFNAEDVSYEKDVNRAVAAAQKAAPSIAQKELDLAYADYELYSYDTLLAENFRQNRVKDGQAPDVEVTLANSVNAARRALTDAKTAVEQKTRSAYNSVLQLTQNHETLSLDYDSAKRGYDTAVTQYIAGYASYFDVQQAQFGLFTAEAAFMTNRLNLRAAVEGYGKAYLN